MDWEYVAKILPLYGKAAVLTVRIGVLGIIFAMLVGLLCSVVRQMKIPVLKQLASVYIELSRNTPLLVQLFFIYYGLPKIGIKTDPETCGVVGLAFLGGSYMAEAFRSGLEAVGKIQHESALSLGLTGLQTFRYVILPQAVKVTLPAMGNEFIAIIKESSVLYAVGVYELTYQANKLASVNYRYLETMIDAALIYFVLTYTMTKLLGLLERRMRRGENSVA